jgi:hypothetical protein
MPTRRRRTPADVPLTQTRNNSVFLLGAMRIKVYQIK